MVLVSTSIIQTSTETPGLLSATSMPTSMLHGGGRNRDNWCTPAWLARALGRFTFDPCSNRHSHIEADWTACLEDGGNGLEEDRGDGVFGPGCFGGRLLNRQLETNYASAYWRTFINPPYSRGQVLRWIRHYKHTNFTFLLRWDPSTQWWRELMSESRWVWFANQRIQFEPPPGVSGSNNPFPHALYFARQPDLDVRKRLQELGRFAFVYNY